MAQHNQANPVNQSFDSIKSFFSDISNNVWLGVLAVIALGGAAYWYRSRTVEKEQVAQRVYAEAIDEYQRGIGGVETAWPNLERLVDASYERHASSTFGPYLLVLKAESLVWQNKHDEAIDVMKKAMHEISTSSPLYFVYKTKFALMMLDSTQEQIRQDGVTQLRALIQDKENTNSDMARFYLGSYYRSNGDTQAAQALLITLVESQTDQESMSPWAQKAQEMLQMIS